jgi:hypothetical protein
MALTQLGEVLRVLRRAYDAEEARGLADAELLGRFVAHHDVAAVERVVPGICARQPNAGRRRR